MRAWTSKAVSPFVAFTTILAVVAAAVAVAAALALRRPVEPRGGLLPFPESQRDDYLLDEIAGHRHRADLRRSVVWPEHADGRFEMRTNNLGFREDAPTEPDKPPGTVRLLVTGDSHTDGVVANPESFPNRLEAILNDATGRTVFEVINAGTGHYGPSNYLGVLRRYLSLEPDQFVVVLYTGNDLLDAVAEAWGRGALEIPERPPRYMDRLKAAERISAAAVSQTFNQILFFASFPDLEQTAIELTMGALDQIQKLCTDHGVRLAVVLLPSKHSVEPATDREMFARVIEALALDDLELGINDRLAAELASELAARSVPLLDPTADFSGSDRELYWRRDHHLSCAGHARLAELYVARFGGPLLEAARERASAAGAPAPVASAPRPPEVAE